MHWSRGVIISRRGQFIKTGDHVTHPVQSALLQCQFVFEFHSAWIVVQLRSVNITLHYQCCTLQLLLINSSDSQLRERVP